MSQRNVRWLFVSWLAPLLLVSGCFLVIGEIPEGSDRGAGAGGVSGADGGVDGEAGASGSGGSAGSTCISGPCDCDGDGFGAVGCAQGSKDDCDDSDERAFPGQVSFFPTERNSGGFDYDCSGGPTKEFGFTDCGGLNVLNLCEMAAQGYYDSTVPCGGTVAFGGCTWSGLSCDQDVAQSNHTVHCH